MAKARAIEGGLLLVATSVFGDEDRKRCAELVRVMDAPHRGDPLTKAEDGPARRARIRAHRRRVAANDPGQEPVTCWGCGAAAPCDTHVGKHGWHTRRIRLCGKAIEVQCPDCFRRWGFIEPRKGA